jgi:hypothetical protein
LIPFRQRLLLKPASLIGRLLMATVTAGVFLTVSYIWEV